MDLGLNPDGDDALVFPWANNVSSAPETHSPIYVDGHVSYNQHIHSVYYMFAFCTWWYRRWCSFEELQSSHLYWSFIGKLALIFFWTLARSPMPHLSCITLWHGLMFSLGALLQVFQWPSRRHGRRLRVWGARMLMGFCKMSEVWFVVLASRHPHTISLQCWQRCYVVWRHLLHQIFVNKDPAWGFLKNKTYDANSPTVCIWKKLSHTFFDDFGCIWHGCCSLRTWANLDPESPLSPWVLERFSLSTLDIGHCWLRCYHMISRKHLNNKRCN